MSRWFRHYAGMMRDEKLVRVAVRAKQAVERVVWVWGAILESAAEINDGGRFELDVGEAAYFLRCDEGELSDILASLGTMGRISDGIVVRWSDRQFDSDKSKDRQARYRERQKASRQSGGDVTHPSRDAEVTLQETETEEDTDKKEEPNGSLSETSSDEKPKSRKRRDYPAEFLAAWRAYPTDANMSKLEAFDAWRKLDETDRSALMASIPSFLVYCREHPDYRPIHFNRYVSKRRFDGHGEASGPAGDEFCPNDWPPTRPLVIRFRNENNHDPPPAVQNGKAGFLLPAAWVQNARNSMNGQYRLEG